MYLKIERRIQRYSKIWKIARETLKYYSTIGPMQRLVHYKQKPGMSTLKNLGCRRRTTRQKKNTKTQE